MALKSTSEVFSGFYKEFTKGATYKNLPEGSLNKHPLFPLNTGREVLVRYFLRSGESTEEEVKGYYPCIIIQDFAPTIDFENAFSREYIDGYFDPEQGITHKMYLPIPMEFNYQVSVVSDNFQDKMAMYDWMMYNFNMTQNGFFEFNRVDTPEGLFNADIVGYKVNASDAARDDGRFEWVFDFSLKAYIHYRARAVEFVENESGNLEVSTTENFGDAVEQIKISLYNKDFVTFEKVLTKEFIIR